jgi:cell division transport system ATP-binding protein
LAEALDSQPVLALDRVEVRRGAFRLLLSELSLHVARGELVFISGPAGGGKSTLLRLIAGLQRPSSGQILVAGQDLSTLNAHARAHLRRQMGIVPQETELFDDCSALENVAAPALIAGERRSDALERARVALERVGLGETLVDGPPAGDLSAGERRRVVLARALSNRPVLLLIDEPPRLDAGPAGGAANASDAGRAGVDIVVGPAGSDPLFDLIGQFCRTGVAAIVVMREPVPAGSSARRCQLADGRLSP